MVRLLINVTCGPDRPTRAAAAFLAAHAALRTGHDVTVFLAEDAVRLLDDGVLDEAVGMATGPLREHYDAIAAAGGRFCLCAAASADHGVELSGLDGKPAELASPERFARLAVEADDVWFY